MLCLGTTVPALADPHHRLEEIAQRRERVQQKIDRLNARSGEILGEIQSVDAKATRVQAEVHVLDERLADLTSKLNEVKADLTEAQQRVTILTEELQAILRRLGDLTDTFTARAVAAYKAGPTAYVDGLLSSTTFSELLNRYAYYESALESDSALVDEIEVLREETETRREQVQREQHRIARAKLRLEAKKVAVSQVRQERASVRDALNAVLSQKESLLSQVESKKRRYQQVQAQLERESAQIQAILAAAAAPSGSLPSGGGQLLWPADGPLISEYGPRTHPIFGDTRMHTGIDIGAGYGAPVIAADAGVVAYAGSMSGYGNVIAIDHGGGLGTMYAHLSALSVGSGQRVGRGTPVGSVGCTGYCTGPHLHFEVRIEGSPVDPMPYLE